MHRRVGKPKSRKGCVTCKYVSFDAVVFYLYFRANIWQFRIRHVKCDEQKPECDQCIRSGRKCDGYSDSSQRELRENIKKDTPRHAWQINSDQRLVLVPGSREERQYVHVFCTQATHALSGFFPSDFWTRFLPQLSQRYPAIRHAVSAVGAVYGKQLLPANFDPAEVEQFTLQQYNKAIQSFIGQMNTPQTVDIDLVLVTCLLFICLETLQSKNIRALDHIQSGVQILAARSQEKKITMDNEFDRELLHTFSRLNIQTCLFGRGIQPLDIQPEKSTFAESHEKLAFDNISQARETLTSLQNRALVFIRSVGSRSGVTYESVYEQHVKQQQAMLAEYYTWRAAFDRLRKRSTKTAGISDLRAPLALLIEYHVSLVWLLNCITQQESNFDNFTSHFEEIVHTAEDILELSPETDSTPVAEQFSLDPGVLAHIYWTAHKCRDPLIRRRAIAALARCPARQGMWLRPLIVQVAYKIVEIEEEPLCYLPVEERKVAEKGRVYEALIYPEQDAQRSPCPVEFWLAPDPVSGDFERIRVDVAW